uniref:Uncharacterized protein n=1 Tax=Arundo donax TaxID=35708 RepID=A0A0A8YN39_ARUDO
MWYGGARSTVPTTGSGLIIAGSGQQVAASRALIFLHHLPRPNRGSPRSHGCTSLATTGAPSAAAAAGFIRSMMDAPGPPLLPLTEVLPPPPDYFNQSANPIRK